MTHITDWIMIAITLVYVIATIFICHANYKSANASREQLAEMKRQYDEKDRPFIDTEIVYLNKTFYVLRFINHGIYTARHVRIELTDEFINSLQENKFKESIIKQRGRECLIGTVQHYDLFLGSNALRNNADLEPIKGSLTYEANGKNYSSELCIDFSNYMTFFSTDTELEKLSNTINKSAKMISKTIKSIDVVSEKE